METHQYKIAKIQDRFLAFTLDLILASPFLAFLVAPLSAEWTQSSLGSEPGLEAGFLYILSIFEMCAAYILAQSLFLTFYKATPGMKFFKLKLQTVSGESLQFSQALLRSTIWVLQFAVFGIPFLDVLSHPLRRGLHDRAAETLLVTLKAEGDPGPQALQAKWAQNMKAGFLLSLIFWVSIVGVRLYSQSMKGEFTKRELIKSQFFCPEIEEVASQPGQSRMDAALALYLTSESDSSCLLREAEFAFWTRNVSERTWAYFAKGIFYQYDIKKAKHYFERTCQQDPDSEPCEMAKDMLARRELSADTLLKRYNSLSFQFLKIKDLISRGQFQLAQSAVSSLSEISAFADYVQKIKVKLLWSQNQTEKAVGAYEVVGSHLSPEHQSDLAAWMCLEQTDSECGKSVSQACSDVAKNVSDNESTHLSSDTVMAYVQSHECTKSIRPVLHQLGAALEENSDLKKLVFALSKDSGWSAEHRLAVLRELSFSKQTSLHLQKRALILLARSSRSEEDRKKIEAYLASSPRHDWTWKKLTRATETKNRLPANSQTEESP